MWGFPLAGRLDGEQNRYLFYLLLSSFTESKKVRQNSSRSVSTSSFPHASPARVGGPPRRSCPSLRAPAGAASFQQGLFWCRGPGGGGSLTCQPEEEFWEVPEAESAQQPSAGLAVWPRPPPTPRGVRGHVDANGERWPGSKNPRVKPSPLASIPVEGELEACVRPRDVHPDPAG